jgi:glycine cleavage system H protein
MSILFTLVTFLLVITISYVRYARREVVIPPANLPEGRHVPQMVREMGFEIPQGYAFQQGHTWLAEEQNQTGRVGIDSFAATLLGNIDNVEVGSLNRWVRQGQKLLTLRVNGIAADVVSPVEGIVTAVNPEVLRDPTLIAKDPYGDGWIVKVHSPDLATNEKNLIHGTLVRPWMSFTLSRFRDLTSPLVGAVAQDGGMPVSGLLTRVDEGMQQALIHEFFLT